MIIKTAITLLSLVLFSTLISISPASGQIVVPPEFENQQGTPTEGIFICTLLPNGARIQALYPAKDLVAGTIGGFNIRTIEGFPAVPPFSIPNVNIEISATNVEPGELSNVFADNTGPDAQTVFTGDLNFRPIPACNTNPCPFNIPVTFSAPFKYDPLDGNLLLDMMVPSCMDGTVPFLLVDSTLELNAIFAADSNASDGDNGFWNITQFVYTERMATLPTVSVWGLMAMAAGFGLIGFFVVRRRKLKAQNIYN